METRHVDIAEVIVMGLAFDPKNEERVASMDFNELLASVGRLFDLLEERETSYVLVGGIAMLAYVEGRNTQDIDLILAREDLESLPELRVEDDNQEFARAWLGELQVNILFTSNELFKLVAEQYSTTRSMAGREVCCASQEGLLLLKLFALPSLYRQGQFDKVRIYEGDIASLLARRETPAADLLDQLRPSLSASDFREVEKIVEEIVEKAVRDKSRFKEE